MAKAPSLKLVRVLVTCHEIVSMILEGLFLEMSARCERWAGESHSSLYQIEDKAHDFSSNVGRRRSARGNSIVKMASTLESEM